MKTKSQQSKAQKHSPNFFQRFIRGGDSAMRPQR